MKERTSKQPGLARHTTIAFRLRQLHCRIRGATLAHEMRIKRTIATTIIALAVVQCAFAVTRLSMPVEYVDDQLCLTFPTNGARWMITIALDKVHPSEYGQRLCLSDRQQVTLSDRHITHEIRAVIQKVRLGFDVTTKEDFRCFGGTVTQETYFISVPLGDKTGQQDKD